MSWFYSKESGSHNISDARSKENLFHDEYLEGKSDYRNLRESKSQQWFAASSEQYQARGSEFAASSEQYQARGREFKTSANVSQQNQYQTEMDPRQYFWNQQHLDNQQSSSMWPNTETSSSSKNSKPVYEDHGSALNQGSFNCGQPFQQSDIMINNGSFGAIGTRLIPHLFAEQQEEKESLSFAFGRPPNISRLEKMRSAVLKEIEFFKGRIRWEFEEGEDDLNQQYKQIDALYSNQVSTLENDLFRNETTISNSSCNIADIREKLDVISGKIEQVVKDCCDYEDAIIEKEREIKAESKILGKKGDEILEKIYDIEFIIKDEKDINLTEIENLDLATDEVKENIKNAEALLRERMKEIEDRNKRLKKEILINEKLINAMTGRNSSLAEFLSKAKKKKQSFKQKLLKFFTRGN